MTAPVLATERLLLRGWEDRDHEPFAAINADPDVMRHFLGVHKPGESAEMVGILTSHFAAFGYGLWAVERKSDGALLGFTGLSVVPFASDFTPATEIGWRLGSQYWGSGYATEAANEVVRFAFEDAALTDLVSFAVPENTPSLAVMERIGMTHNPDDDFNHPRFPEGHRLCRHVLYRLAAAEWSPATSD